MPHTTKKGEAFTWHHAAHAKPADVEFVCTLFALAPRDAALLAEPESVPRFYDRGDRHILRLHIPSVHAAHRTYKKLDLTFVFNKHTVVTMTDGKIAPLEKAMSTKAVPRELRSGNVGDVIAWLLHEVLDVVDPVIDAVFADIERMTHAMHGMRGDAATRGLGALRRDVLLLDVMVEPAVAVLAQYIDTRTPYRAPRTTAQLDGVVDRLRAMHVILVHDAKLLDAISREHEAMLSHRTNRTVQFLTVISVLLMPPTLVASYYGMNVVGLPWAHDIRVVSAVIAVAVVVFLLVIARILRR